MKKQLTITIKQATENDIPIIESILLDAVNWLNEMGQPLWSAEAVTWTVLSKKHQAEDFHIAYLDGKPSGCMAIIDYDPFFWPDVKKGASLFAHKVAVVKDARKSGVSDALINYFKEQGTVRGVKTIRLDVHVTRSRLRNFYERHGFILLEIKEYSDGRDTAFYMYTLPDAISVQNKYSGTRLVFVEGVSGVGKSTLAKNLCDSLCEKGYNAACYLEFDFDNPIDFYCTAYFKQHEYADLLVEYSAYSGEIQANTIFADDVRLVRYYNRETPLFPEPLLDVLRKHEFCWKPSNLVSISEYTRVYKAVWEHFAENVSSHPDYLIFDGSLFHHPINDMMRNYNASSDEVICHVNTLIETVRRLQPLVIYLSSDNAAERLQKARVSRKEAPPSTEQISFWEERKKIDMAVMIPQHQQPDN